MEKILFGKNFDNNYQMIRKNIVQRLENGVLEKTAKK